MIANASGRPSAPARAIDCGVPPTAIHTGSGILQRARIDAEVFQRRAQPPLPSHALVGADGEQQLELLGEQFVVVVEVVAEQREQLDERAAPRHDLGATAGEQVERGVLLVDAHRIVGTQHGDGARQADGLGARRRVSERHRRRRNRVVGPMVLAEREHVEADAVGELDLRHRLGQRALDMDRLTRRRIALGLDKRVDAELHGSSPRGGAGYRARRVRV